MHVVLVTHDLDKERTDGTAMAIVERNTLYMHARSETVKECNPKTLPKSIHCDLSECCKFNGMVNSDQVTKITVTPLNRPLTKSLNRCNTSQSYVQ